MFFKFSKLNNKYFGVEIISHGRNKLSEGNFIECQCKRCVRYKRIHREEEPKLYLAVHLGGYQLDMPYGNHYWLFKFIDNYIFRGKFWVNDSCYKTYVI